MPVGLIGINYQVSPKTECVNISSLILIIKQSFCRTMFHSKGLNIAEVRAFIRRLYFPKYVDLRYFFK